MDERVASEHSMPSSTTASTTVPSGLAQQHTRGPGDLPRRCCSGFILPRKADPLAVRALYVDEQRTADFLVRPSSNAATGRRPSDRRRRGPALCARAD